MGIDEDSDTADKAAFLSEMAKGMRLFSFIQCIPARAASLGTVM
jgi:hypothetical protein